jgi:hypothetical protein
MPQLKHSAQPVYDRAVNPPPGRGREEVDDHMAQHVEAGWKLAFYSTNATSTGHYTSFHLGGAGYLVDGNAAAG